MKKRKSESRDMLNTQFFVFINQAQKSIYACFEPKCLITTLRNFVSKDKWCPLLDYDTYQQACSCHIFRRV